MYLKPVLIQIPHHLDHKYAIRTKTKHLIHNILCKQTLNIFKKHGWVRGERMFVMEQIVGMIDVTKKPSQVKCKRT
jgi:hypothetical protein